MSTSPVTFSIISAPSRSKGWGRYRAPAVGVRSSTGNPWVSADHGGAGDGGATFMLDIEVELNVGSGARARKEREMETFALVVEAGASCVCKNIPGSQGMTVRVDGARLA